MIPNNISHESENEADKRKLESVCLGLTKRVLFVICVALVASSTKAQDYRSSVVGTDFDFIKDSDPSCFLCLEFKGRGYREMPDKTGPTLLVQESFVFVAYYGDGTKVDIAVDVDFDNPAAAKEEALRYATRLGKLPTALRMGVDRLVVHKGYENTTAFSDVGLIVMYSDNASKRISSHDLEETLFHESVHAAWDKTHADSKQWRSAQASDKIFITSYARKNPDGEDLAESALFAYTLIHHPERIPADEARKIKQTIPARIRFVEKRVPRDKPITFSVGPKYACDGAGKTFTISRERYLASQAEFKRKSKECIVDLTRPGVMKDIVSNALILGLKHRESDVAAFLKEAETRYSTGQELLKAAARNFNVSEADLTAQVKQYKHCNCKHGPLGDSPQEPKPSRNGK
jgi:hypothetical protein